MPQKDIRSGLLPKLAFNANISTDTTTAGAIIDTAHFDGGIVFTLLSQAYTDGTYTPLIEEGDDAALSDAAAVPDNRLIGTEAGAALSAVSASGADLGSIGVLTAKRYLRLSIVSASTTTGADIVATVHQKAELSPAAGLSA